MVIVGAGAFGTALSIRLSQKEDVFLVSNNEKIANEIRKTRTNPCFLSNTVIPNNVYPIYHKEIVPYNDVVFICIGASKVIEIIDQYAAAKIIVLCSKGVTKDREWLIKAAAKIVGEEKICVLSGPSFAEEVADIDKKIILSLAGYNNLFTSEIQNLYNNQNFILKKNYDIIGTHICGVIKNIVAIGVGILYDTSLSIKANFINNCIKDIINIVRFYDGDIDTIYEPCGIPDLMMTCYSEQSRNFQYGKQLRSYSQNKEMSSEGSESIEIIKRIGSFLDLTCLQHVYDFYKGYIDINDFINRI